MTEYETISLMLTYASEVTFRFQIFMAASVAMIVAGYMAGEKLNIYLKGFVITLYTGYGLVQFMLIDGWMRRASKGVATLVEITKDQAEILPLS